MTVNNFLLGLIVFTIALQVLLLLFLVLLGE